MSITKILSNPDNTAAEKLERVADIVAQVRSAYGNEDAEIASPYIQTAFGNMSFVHLEDDAKVEVLRAEVAGIKVAAVEYAAHSECVNINKKIEELIAVNGAFANISSGTKFEYI